MELKTQIKPTMIYFIFNNIFWIFNPSSGLKTTVFIVFRPEDGLNIRNILLKIK